MTSPRLSPRPHGIHVVPRSQFDGNRSNRLTLWMFASDDFPELYAKMLDELMAVTVDRSILSWVVFPPEGFRL